MRVREIMTRDVRIASPGDDLQRAAQLMEKDDFGLLPVGENDRLVGMLSDRDIAIRAVARGLAPDRCKVREVMTTCDPAFANANAEARPIPLPAPVTTETLPASGPAIIFYSSILYSLPVC